MQFYVIVSIIECLGLTGDAAAKDIYESQEWKNCSLLTRAHLALLPHHLVLSSLTFLSKVVKIHSFLSRSIYGITSNLVLRSLQERSACDSGLLSLSSLRKTWENGDCKLFFRMFRIRGQTASWNTFSNEWGSRFLKVPFLLLTFSCSQVSACFQSPLDLWCGRGKVSSSKCGMKT